MRSAGRIRIVAIALATTWFAAACGNSAKQNAAVRAEQRAAIRRAEHPSFPVPPCSLLTLRQVSQALGVRVEAQTSRSGCLYSGVTAAHDTRTLTVTPGAEPASGSLISSAIRNPVSLTGSGYRARIGTGTPPGGIRVPVTAVAGVVADQVYVSLLVQDANPDAPTQLQRAIALTRQVGQSLQTRR
jgi:hypothetical protein